MKGYALSKQPSDAARMLRSSDMIHPDRRVGEVFVSNVSAATFQALPSETKRLGISTFDGNGRPFSATDWYPLFVNIAEYAPEDLVALLTSINAAEGFARR